MSFNNELYTKVLEKIKANPQEWCQLSWCGTSCCFAGHTAILAGYKMQKPDEDGDTSMKVIARNGRRVWVDEVAADKLGLNHVQKDWLFEGHRTIQDFEDFQAKALIDPDYCPEDADDADDFNFIVSSDV